MNRQKPPTPNFVTVSAAQGIETKVDASLVSPPKALQADNIRLTTLGATRKRYGMQLMTTAGVGNVTVGSTEKQLIALVNGQLKSYDADDNIWVAGTPGAVPGNSLKVTYLGSPQTASYGLKNASLAIVGDIGIMCYDVYRSVTSTVDYIVLSCFDIYTGEQFWSTNVTGASMATGSAGWYIGGHGASSAPAGFSGGQPHHHGGHVHAFNSQVLFTFTQSGTLLSSPYSSVGALLRAFIFTPSRTAPVNPFGSLNCTQLDNFAFPTMWGTSSTSQSYDAQLRYDVANNSTDLAIIAISGNPTADTNATISAFMTNTTSPITQSTSFTKTYTSWTVLLSGMDLVTLTAAMTDQLNYVVIAASLSGVLSINTPSSGTTPAFSSVTIIGTLNQQNMPFDIWVSLIAANAFNFTLTDGVNVWSGNGVGTLALNVVNTFPFTADMLPAFQGQVASRIVTYNGAPHVWINARGKNDNVYFRSLVFVNLTNFSIVARAFYLSGGYVGGERPPDVLSINGAPSTILLQQAQDAADNTQLLRLVGVTSGPTHIIRTPDGALISGADTKYFDNLVVRSAGFLRIPSIGVTAGGGSGSLINGQTYSVIVVVADYDAAGNAIYSSPSSPVSVTLSGSATTYTVDLSDVYTATTNFKPVILIYRTSQTNPLSYNLAGTIYTAKTGSGVTSWTDPTPDDITSNAQLYSQGTSDELPNDPAPPSTSLVATKTRIFLAGPERPSALYFSKPLFYGRAPEFNYGNVLDIEPSTGGIVGLAALDEVVVIFKTSHIYLLSGQGPDATGSGAFNAITNISTDRGLVDSNSIAVSNDGIYFRSQRGIELLDRSFSLQYVGSSVETLLAGRTVLSALSVPAQSQVRFALSDGKVLVYDYSAGGWTTYTYNLGSVALAPQINTQTVFRGNVYIAANGTSAGQIYQESSTFVDETSLYSTTVQTAHIPLAGQQGWGRIRRANILGNAVSVPARLSVQFVYDYGQVVSPPIYYDVPATGPFNVRVRAPRQVAESASVIVTSSTSSGTGEGAYISSIVLETLQKSGALRTSDDASV